MPGVRVARVARVNVLVTGGAGFIGSALVARLAAGGHRVAVVDDGSTGCAERLDGAAAFARAARCGAAPAIHGDGLDERDYVHLDDVLDAFVLALGMRGDGVFNVGTGVARTVREVFAAVARAAGYAGDPAYGPARPGDARRSCLDPR